MDWLWSWAAPDGALSLSSKEGANSLVDLIANAKESTERRVRAVECLDVVRGSLPDGYDSVCHWNPRLVDIFKIHEILQSQAVSLLEYLSTIPSSSSTPQPLIQYLLTLPKVLTSPHLPSTFSSLQLIHASEALQVLAELGELESWSPAHLAPLSLALHYVAQVFETSDDLDELLQSAPMTALKVIGPGRSVLGVLGKVAKHLADQHLDRGLAAIAKRELLQVCTALLDQSVYLQRNLAQGVLRLSLSVAIQVPTSKDMASHVPRPFVWTALQQLITMERADCDKQSVGRIMSVITALLQRPSLEACDLPSEALYHFAYGICHLLADAQVAEQQATSIFDECQRFPLLATCFQNVASAQSDALARDAQELPIALAISKADGSNFTLLLALTQIRQQSWTPILRALGHDGTYPHVITRGSQQVTEAELLSLLAPELAKSVLPAPAPLPYNPYVPPSNTASAYSGKVYTQQEFRAARYVKGQPFVPMGYGPQANQLSQSSRAPSRHVDDFAM